MPPISYSYLDVAILDDVRERFAVGDALVVLTLELDEVIWTNGPGARLLGLRDIETAIGLRAPLGPAAQRQIMATSGYPAIGRDRVVLARLNAGGQSQLVGFLASAIVLPDGEPAILLAKPANHPRSRSQAEIGERAIAGFGQPGEYVALLDGAGTVVAATSGFYDLGIDSRLLHTLALAVAGETDRLVKRIVEGSAGRFPAGIARLTDDPAANLLIVVDENAFDAVTDPLPGQIVPPEAAALTGGGEVWTPEPEAADTPASPVGTTAEPAEEDSAQAEPQVTGDELRADDTTAQPASGDAGPADAAPSQPDHAERAAVEAGLEPPPELAAGQWPAEISDADDTPASGGTEHDGWYFSHRHDEEPRPDGQGRRALPVRFVWRTDADGRFSAISPELAAVVGDTAAVVGRSFGAVAAAYGFDRSAEIVALFERRDTWSGRTVLWPVAGSSSRVPVDLAALPVYGRDRAFEGFRGFGVARPADAVDDTAIVETAQTEDGDDPFRGEMPALASATGLPDKVIRLEEHRAAGERKLSPGERMAFQEIGQRLKRDDEAEAGRPAEAEPPASSSAEEEAGMTAEAPVGESGAAHPDVTAPGDGPQPADPDLSERDEPEAIEPEAAAPGVPEPAERLNEVAAVTTPAAEPPPEADPAPGEPAGQEPDESRAAAGSAAPPKPRETGSASLMTTGFIPSAFAPGPALRHPARQPDVSPALPAEAPFPAAGIGVATEMPAKPAAAPAERDTAQDTSILARLPVPVLIHSGDMLHYANPAFLYLTAFESLDELREAGGLERLFVDSYGDEAVPDGSVDRQLRMRTNDGMEFPIDAILRSVPWGAGHALMLVVRRTGEDESGAEPEPSSAPPLVRELQARVAELTTIIDTATDGILLIAPDLTIRSISRPAEALFGFESDDVRGKAFVSLFAVESQRVAMEYLDGIADGGVASLMNDGREVIGRESEGRFIPLFMTVGRLPDDNGYCAVVRDITQWKRAEEELTQARAAAERTSSQKTEFLARISHEIRTPLNAIIGFSELMLDGKFGAIGNDRYRDYLRDINRSGNHVLDLVNDLLDITKIEAGQQEMSYVPVSLNETLAETVAMMQPQANRERVIIRSSFASRLPDVVADLRSIRQIALNIFSNAVRYTQAGGQVIVSTAQEANGDVVMRVRDTGIGMSPAEIEHALKPFKQINALKRTRGDGTGLGLPLTKAMVEANRARFLITSTPGEGTLVEITFPASRVLAEPGTGVDKTA